MAIVLIGRGISGRAQIKLNLNNVKLEKIVTIDHEAVVVRWTPGGGHNFFAASDMRSSNLNLRGDEIRRVYREFLYGRNPKCFIRGKYELWFFIKFLATISQKLGNKDASKASGLQRARFDEAIGMTNGLESLCTLAPCPPELANFLSIHLPPTI